MATRSKSFLSRPLAMRLLTGCLAGMSLSVFAQEDTFRGDPSRYTFIPISSSTDDWLRHFRLGAMVGMNITAKFGLSGGYPFGTPFPKGVYSDGYVLPDKTGDPTYTSNWGYDNASQYNAAKGTLTFSSASSYQLNNNVQSSDDGYFPGLDMAYGGNLWYWKHARVGWEIGFGLLPINITDRNAYGIKVSQTSYIYNVGSIIVPTAPYSGGPSGLGPIINSQNPTTSTANGLEGTLGGSRTLDVMLYTLRLGPTFYWDISQKFSASFGLGPAVGLASGELDYNDIITVSGQTVSTRNSGSVSATDFTFGGYVNGTLLYHVDDRADLYLGVQYMPMGSADFNGGGRQAQLQLDGQIYISAGINWPF